MPKKITLEKVASMVQKGFNGTDKRFDKVDERLAKIENRVARLDVAIFVDHKRRIQKLEADVEILKDVAGIK